MSDPQQAPIASLEEAVCAGPDVAKAFSALAGAHMSRHEFTDAAYYMRAAARLNPDNGFYRLGLGLLATHAGALERAREEYEAGVRCASGPLQPQSGPFRSLVTLVEHYMTVLDRPAEALPLCIQAIAADPEAQRPYYFLCRTCTEEESVGAMLSRAEAALPPNGHPEFLPLAMCHALIAVGGYADARMLLKRELQANPQSAQILGLLGHVEQALGDEEAARRHLAQVIELARPERLDRSAWAVATEHPFRTGDRRRMIELARLGADTERGQRIPAARPPESLAGKTFKIKTASIRWAPLARVFAAHGARVFFECDAPFRRLFERVDGAEGVVQMHEEWPPHDEAQEAQRILCALEWAWDEFKTAMNCLDIPAALTRRWRTRMISHGRGMHVGLDWRKPGYLVEKDAYTNTAIPLRQLAEVMMIPDVICHSLHARPRAGELSDAVRLTRIADDIQDWYDAAAAISALDLVVTADTEIAHLAGVLGKPTLLMLPRHPEYGWGDRDTPIEWYSSARRFQQRRAGDWMPVIDEVANAVRSYAALSAPVPA